MQEVVLVKTNNIERREGNIMLSFKIRCFLKNESLSVEDEMYLLTKKCTCVACKAYTQKFQTECPKEKLAYLKYISRP